MKGPEVTKIMPADHEVTTAEIVNIEAEVRRPVKQPQDGIDKRRRIFSLSLQVSRSTRISVR